ncbi:MAG: hypothetical protein A2Y56_02845 [Candidatus Aminicenantes bacterium RBG_13_63_10]|nr:MAG: hypothetical protein A2Y56_02845 [Candidatus Aminicenantes bacterium RBG_13_63_10]
MIERTRENGVEIITNHLDPYILKGEPASFTLTREVTIDLGRNDLASQGIGSVGEIAVDSKGNIYAVSFKNLGTYVFKFNPQGKLLSTFGRQGAGPGELQWPFHPVFDDHDRLYITDYMRKFVVFDSEGRVISERKFNSSILQVEPLPDGNLLVYRPDYERATSPSVYWSLAICDQDLLEKALLDRHRWGDGNSRFVPFFVYRVSGDRIFVANEERSYEILVFDLRGRLVRRIKKEFRPIAPSESFKKIILGPSYRASVSSYAHYFPNLMPPLFHFFTDDTGRLFVMTYEEGENPGEYLYDFFNNQGVFVGRKSLGFKWFVYGGAIYSLIKNGRLYCKYEREDGYDEIAVYSVHWYN